MTPFEFDLNPFDGWSFDGILGTADDTGANAAEAHGVVWGVERPEILITETHAWHDRRSEDLSSSSTPTGPGGGNTTTGDPTNPDLTFDQRLVPIPAAFIELYNPWVTQYSTLNSGTAAPYLYAPASEEVPGDLYYDTNNTNAGLHPLVQPYSGTTPNPPIGVVLNKLDPTGNSPVWRLAFASLLPAAGAGSVPTVPDPDDPFQYTPAVPLAYDRVAYFVSPPAVYDDAAMVRYYTSQPVSPLKPGRYAVVGSANQLMPAANALPAGQTANANVYVSKVGRALLPTPATDSVPQTINTRRIVLAPDPNSNPDNNQFWVIGSGEASAAPIVGQGEPSRITASGGSDAQPVVAIAVDQAVGYPAGGPNGYPYGRSLAISDPAAGYGTPAAALTPASTMVLLSGNTEEETVFSPPLSLPADSANPYLPAANMTVQSHHVVYLQRLANPQLPWNATTNPYRTIDQMTTDLTVFNGVWPNPAVTVPNSKPSDPSLPGGQTYKFVTTQRGDQYVSSTYTTNPFPPVSNQSNLLWAQEPPHPTGAPRRTAS